MIQTQIQQPKKRNVTSPSSVRLLVVVEGMNDIEFLRRMSGMLHATDNALPNVAMMEQVGEIVFVPFGGGQVRAWSERLAPLNLPEFHVYDRELPPESDLRIEAAKAVNARANCQAVVTSKRCLESYLHPEAILAAGGVHVRFYDFDPVAELTAQELYRQRPGEIAWQLQARRSQSRMANRAKRWLNTIAADHMTTELLAESDRDGEVISWMLAINQLLASHHNQPKDSI